MLSCYPIVFFLTSIGFTHALFDCEDLVDCTCSETNNIRIVECNNAGLKEVPNFTFLKQYQIIDSILLNGNQITDIKSYAFAELSVRKINLSNNSISNIYSRAFDTLNGLEDLDLSINPEIRSVPPAIRTFQSLKKLNLHNVELSEFRDNDFENLINLEYLDLSHNSITIHSSCRAFRFLRNLIYLNLENCGFKDIPKPIIYNTPRLETLILIQNRIRLLHVDLNVTLPRLIELDISRNSVLFRTDTTLFEGFSNLAILTISGCELIKVDANTFRTLTNLTKLTLFECNIRTIKDNSFSPLSKLQYLNVGGNFFNLSSGLVNGLETTLSTLVIQDLKVSQFPKSMLASMKKLLVIDLENNDITTLDRGQFNSLQRRDTHIYLKNNNIDYIHAEVLEDAKIPVNLYVQDNFLSDLTFLNDDVCQFNGMTVDVSRNNILCDCSTKETIQKKVLNLIGECSRPSIFTGKKLNYQPKNVSSTEKSEELADTYFEFAKVEGCHAEDRTREEYSCYCKTWNVIGMSSECPYISASASISWTNIIFPAMLITLEYASELITKGELIYLF